MRNESQSLFYCIIIIFSKLLSTPAKVKNKGISLEFNNEFCFVFIYLEISNLK